MYAVDADFGPFFLKFCSYFPYNAKPCLNGVEWAKRQATKAGIGFTGLDNGFAVLDDPADDFAAPVHLRRSGRGATAMTSRSGRRSSP